MIVKIIFIFIVCCLVLAKIVFKAPEMIDMKDLKKNDIFHFKLNDKEHESWIVLSKNSKCVYCESRNMGLAINSFNIEDKKVYFVRNNNI